MYKKTDLESDADDEMISFRSVKSSFSVSFKLIWRRLARLPVLGRFLILSPFIFLLAFVLYQLLLKVGDVLNRPSFLEFHKCPACYGFKACDAIKNDEIIADPKSVLKGFFFSNQHTIYGKHVKGMNVIISKLGDQESTTIWENKICDRAKKKPRCHVSEAAKSLFPNSGSKWILEAVKGQSLMTTCPTERLISAITFRYMEMLDTIDISNRERIQLVLTIWRNQSPIIWQTFSKSLEWPFPQYIGACGRAVVYENPGEPLYKFLDEPWDLRIRLALKILNIAHKFTYNPSQYGIYMMKVNYESFYYKKETDELFYNDPQSILVVDKWQLEENLKENKGTVRENYIKNLTLCEVGDKNARICKNDENWMSTKEPLCNSVYSDHNYYTVCRNVFSPFKIRNNVLTNVGLLHNMPSDIDVLFNLKHLIEMCINPKESDTRKDTVLRMIKVLKDIIDNNDSGTSQDSDM